MDVIELVKNLREAVVLMKGDVDAFVIIKDLDIILNELELRGEAAEEELTT